MQTAKKNKLTVLALLCALSLGSLKTAFAQNNEWENPLNWSCGVLPWNGTNVIINSGNINVSTNVIITSLTLSPGVNIHVLPGVEMVILKSYVPPAN